MRFQTRNCSEEETAREEDTEQHGNGNTVNCYRAIIPTVPLHFGYLIPNYLVISLPLFLSIFALP